jgi:hypothetical protein
MLLKAASNCVVGGRIQGGLFAMVLKRLLEDVQKVPLDTCSRNKAALYRLVV